MIFLGFLASSLYNLLQENAKHVTLSMVYTQSNEIIKENMKIELFEKNKKKLQDELDIYLSIDNENELIHNLNNEISEMKKFAGLTNLYGQGIIIIINDSKIINSNYESSLLIVHDFDIQNIISDLRNAGAEAISINGERVVAGKSKIKCAGPTIQINDKVVAQPFIIKAIGDKYYLEASVNSPDGYADILREWDIFVEVNTSVSVTVPAYNGNLEFKYIEDYKGDEKWLLHWLEL